MASQLSPVLWPPVTCLVVRGTQQPIAGKPLTYNNSPFFSGHMYFKNICLFSALLDNISLIRKRHHCRRGVAKLSKAYRLS